MNYKELICLQRIKELELTTQKKVFYEWKKKKKYLLGKPVHFSIKNTANSVDKWWFIH